MQCAVHNKPMKQNRGGYWYSPTPVAKSADGKTVLEWCPWKPDGVSAVATKRADGAPTPSDADMPPALPQSFNNRALDEGTSGEPDWDYIGRVKALCGMVNGRLAVGQPVEKVIEELPQFTRLVKAIEAEAKHVHGH